MHAMRKHVLPAVAVLTVAVAWAWADSPEAETRAPRRPDSPRRMVASAPSAHEGQDNLLAIHDVASSSYNGDCLSCHSGVLTEQTQDPRILSFHQAMLPFTPGYNPRRGPSNDTCVQCHRHVDLVMDSAGALRKQVDPALCALCHGPSGPGPVYYAR